MYTTINFKSKKALKEAVKAGQAIRYFQPGPFGGNEQQNGTFSIEGPHYPQPHKWYARCEAVDGLITKVS